MQRSESKLVHKLKPVPKSELIKPAQRYNEAVRKRRIQYQYRTRESQRQIRGIVLTD